MALQGQTMIAASGDSGSEDCYPVNGSLQLGVDDPGSQPTWSAPAGRPWSALSASSQVVWNCRSLCGASPGAGGGGYSQAWTRNPGQPLPAAFPGGSTDPCGSGAGVGCRSVPDISYPSDPSQGSVAAYFDGSWAGFGGTSVAAPTNAGLFADTNQGCFNRLGRVGPALYAADTGSNYTDIVTGNNDFTGTQPGRLHGRSPASTPPAASARPSTRTSPSRCRAPTGAPRWPR